jgi:hypothetical protein
MRAMGVNLSRQINAYFSHLLIMFSLFFFARITFITGLFFGVSWGLLSYEHSLNPDLVSMILTLGFGMGLVLFPSFVLTCLLYLLLGKLQDNPTPRWLIIANFLWLLLFVIFILFLNGPNYYQP